MNYYDYMDRVLALVEDGALKPCETCRGLLAGLPPQCYNETEECTCNEEETNERD